VQCASLCGKTFSERPLNLQNCFYESSAFYKHFFRYIFSHIYLFHLIFSLKSLNSAVKAAAVKTAKRAVFLFSRLYCIKWFLLQSFSVSAAVFIPAPVQSSSHEGGEGVPAWKNKPVLPAPSVFSSSYIL
jgi:hypothetical protein